MKINPFTQMPVLYSTSIYACRTYDSQEFCESNLTDDEVYAKQYDSYDLVSLQELNIVAASIGEVFEGVLNTADGLAQYKKGKYSLLSDDPVLWRFTDKYEHYINGLYSTCYKDVDSFIAWLVDIHHYSVDGWVVRNLKEYINTKSRLATFFERFEKVYKFDLEYLTKCSIDIITLYKEEATA